MTTNKKKEKNVDYKVINHIEHYNFGINHVNILDYLKLLNFEFQNLRN
jgi:hypothetical protein